MYVCVCMVVKQEWASLSPETRQNDEKVLLLLLFMYNKKRSFIQCSRAGKDAEVMDRGREVMECSRAVDSTRVEGN